MVADVEYRNKGVLDEDQNWLPATLRFPATIFVAMCPIVLMLEFMFSGIPVAFFGLHTVSVILQRSFLALVPIFAICLLVTMANLMAYRARQKRHEPGFR
jgi:hypothetical protein